MNLVELRYHCGQVVYPATVLSDMIPHVGEAVSVNGITRYVKVLEASTMDGIIHAYMVESAEDMYR